jgi:hypothetical protein
MNPDLIQYFAQIDLDKNPRAIGNKNLVSVTPFGKQLAFAGSYLESQGFFSEHTIERDNKLDKPWPILTWPFLDFIASLKLSDTTLIELGAGGSTLAFAKLFNRVVSFENSAKFVEVLKNKLPENASVTHFAGDIFDIGAVDLKPDDWILVDFSGKRTRFIKDLTTDRSESELPVVVILDNSDWYRNGAQLLASAGYSEIPFFGLKSGQTWVSCTSFFFVPNRLRLQFNAPFRQPLLSRPLSASWDSLD